MLAQVADNKILKRNVLGQASVEYVLLLALIAVFAYKGVKHFREIFFGWDKEQGAIVMLLDNNIKSKLSTSETDGF